MELKQATFQTLYWFNLAYSDDDDSQWDQTLVSFGQCVLSPRTDITESYCNWEVAAQSRNQNARVHEVLQTVTFVLNSQDCLPEFWTVLG